MEEFSPLVLNAWYTVAWSADVTDRPLARTICNEPMVLFRGVGGQAAALEDRCCHRAMPLSRGAVQGDRLECGYHGLVFDHTGQCVHIPGQDTIPPSARVRSFPLVERDDLLWVWPGDPAKADPAEIPVYPFHRGPQAWPYRATTFHVKSNYQLLTDNLLDLTHLAYVHKATVGGAIDAENNVRMETNRTPRGVRFIRWLLDTTPPPTYQKLIGFPGNIDRWQEFEFFAPGTVFQFTGALGVGQGAYEQGNRDGGFALRVFHGVTPETEHSCHYFWSSAHGFQRDNAAITEKLFGVILATFKEDEEILEAQYDRLRRFGHRPLVSIKSDVARVASRQVVARLAAAERGEALAAE